MKLIMKKNYFWLVILSFLALCSNLFSQNLTDGIKLLKNESYQNAISAFKSYIQLNPAKADGYYYLGKTYLSLGNNDSANVFFQKGISVNNNYALNYIGLGGVALSKVDTNAAASEFNKALDINDEDQTIFINIADMYLIVNNSPAIRALDYLGQAVSLKKNNPTVYIKIGGIYLLLNNGTQAIANYENAINYDSSQVDAYIGLANVYTAVRNYTEAEQYYQIAIKKNPDYSKPYKYLADMYSTTKANDKAVEAFKKYISLSESSNANLKKLSVLLYSAGQYQECADAIKSISNYSTNIPLLHLLAYTYSQLGDTTDGIPTFNQYFGSIDKKDITVSDYELLSRLYLKENQDSLAIELLKTALNLDNTRLDLLTTIRMIYFKDRDWSGVIYAINKKLSLSNSLNAQDYFDLGKAYYFNKDYGLADTAFTELVKLKPDLPIGYRWVAAAKANLDPDSEQGLAKDDYDKFISIAQNDTVKYKIELIEAYSYLGYYYFLKKDMENSKLNWQKVYALDPTNTQAIEAIKKIK